MYTREGSDDFDKLRRENPSFFLDRPQDIEAMESMDRITEETRRKFILMNARSERGAAETTVGPSSI